MQKLADVSHLTHQQHVRSMGISRVGKEKACIEVVVLLDQADMDQNNKITQSAVWDWWSRN